MPAPLTDAAASILATVEREGLLLVHDQVLPSVTALVAGEVVTGSWWSHPCGHTVYDALGALEDRVATVKLVRGKDTLVAPRLWARIAAIGTDREGWQTDHLTGDQLALLFAVDVSDDGVTIDARSAADARVLEKRFLVHGESQHTSSGWHQKVLRTWAAWARHHELDVPEWPDAEDARRTLTAVVTAWPGGSAALLPWPSPPG